MEEERLEDHRVDSSFITNLILNEPHFNEDINILTKKRYIDSPLYDILRGVVYDEVNRMWACYYYPDTRHKSLKLLGRYDTIMEAVMAYDNKIRELYKSDYLLNLSHITPRETKRKQGKAQTRSKYTGVYFFKLNMNWRAKITKDRVTHFLGTFDTEEQAARAYFKKKIELFGGERVIVPNIPDTMTFFPADVTEKEFLEHRMKVKNVRNRRRCRKIII